MRRPKPRMNAREEPREVAFLSECKGQARRMQQLGGQIAINGNQRPGGNQRCPGRPRKMPRGRGQRAVRRRRRWEARRRLRIESRKTAPLPSRAPRKERTERRRRGSFASAIGMTAPSKPPYANIKTSMASSQFRAGTDAPLCNSAGIAGCAAQKKNSPCDREQNQRRRVSPR